jgi:hypothetical protein
MLLVGNNLDAIKEINMHLSSMLDTKDLNAEKFIMGMEVKRDREIRKIWLNQRNCIETILKCFNMKDFKPVKVLILVGEKLTTEQFPKTWREIEDMKCIPYASVVGNLMYVMVCT